MHVIQDPLPFVGFVDPGWHFKHFVASSVPLRYSPKPHFKQGISGDDAPILPGWQSMHVSWEVAPMAFEYVPALHGEHLISASRPSSVLYVPAGHPLHAGCSSFSLYLPSLHSVHFDTAVSPLLYPIGQTLQSDLPGSFWNLPVKHGRQNVEPCWIWYSPAEPVWETGWWKLCERSL